MKRFWCCRDLEGAANEEVFLFVGEEPPIMDDDGEWVDPRKEGLFWSEEDFSLNLELSNYALLVLYRQQRQ